MNKIKIHSSLPTKGESKDGINFENVEDVDYTISKAYHKDSNIVTVVEIMGKVFLLDKVKEIVQNGEHVENTEDDDED